MASSPSFAATPKFTNMILNNSNGGDNGYTAPTTVATILTMGTSGGRIDSVYIRPVGTNASTAVRFFVDTVGTGGAANRLINEEYVAATAGTSTATLTPVVWRPGLVLPANCVLRATVANTAVTVGVAISVEYSEF